MAKIIPNKYPEERNIDKWVGFLGNGNVNIVFLWRYAAYCRDIIKAKNIADVGLRDTAEQKRLYDLYKAGKGNIAAAPGTSWHEYGLAIDLNRYKTNADGTGQYYGTINADYYNWLADKPEVLNQYGLAHSVKGEIWHIQPIETIGYGGDKSKFSDSDDYLRSNYREPIATVDPHLAEIDGKNQQINDLHKEVSELKEQIIAKDKEVYDAEMKVVEIANAKGALETENALLEKDNADIQNTLNSAQSAIAEKNAQIMDLTQKFELKQIQYAELVKENISHVQEIDKLNGKILTMQAEIESMRKIKPTEIVVPKETLASLMRRLFKLK